MQPLLAAFPCLYVIALAVAPFGLVLALSLIWGHRGSSYGDIYRKDRR